ncbi:hypothetical protein [Campylobacter sp. MG1]|uniref:hypothetical protein n=1 Tax=Campylobacter sp. MG1 TaxID=2976332 RepID=UPI00226CFD23|nr:hypothetical protein [Campylobacter sp. MG1]
MNSLSQVFNIDNNLLKVKIKNKVEIEKLVSKAIKKLSYTDVIIPLIKDSKLHAISIIPTNKIKENVYKQTKIKAEYITYLTFELFIKLEKKSKDKILVTFLAGMPINTLYYKRKFESTKENLLTDILMKIKETNKNQKYFRIEI